MKIIVEINDLFEEIIRCMKEISLSKLFSLGILLILFALAWNLEGNLSSVVELIKALRK